MLFYLILGIFAIFGIPSLVLTILSKIDERNRMKNGNKKFRKIERFWYHHSEKFLVPLFISGACFLISLLVLLIYNAAFAETIISAEEKYESLTYQYENSVYDESSDIIGKSELFNEIEKWNKEYRIHKYYENNFWVGIYVPEYPDHLKEIEYKLKE